MQLPIIKIAPIVAVHGPEFRDVFNNRCQYQHFENYVTGLMVLDDKSMANIARCIVESADKTNLSRFFSDAPLESMTPYASTLVRCLSMWIVTIIMVMVSIPCPII